MAFENSQAFGFESKQLVSTNQFESTCRLEVNSDKPIKRVVCVYALAKLVSSEKIDGGINFSGRTAYQVVYQTEEGALASAISYVDWQDKIASFSYDNFYIYPKAVENTVTGFSANEVAISTLMNIEVYSVVTEKVAGVEGLTEDYICEEKNYEYNRAVNTISENFNEVVEQEISTKLDDILYYTGSVKLNSVTPGIDTITLEGEVNVLTYALENNNVTLINKTIDFKQEIASLSTAVNNIVDASVDLAELKVSLSVSDIDQKSNLIYSVELSAYCSVFSKESITVVEDAFSVKKETLSNREGLVKTSFVNCGNFTDSVSGGFEVDKEVDELLFISSASGTITDIIPNEQGVTLNGAVQVTAVCESESKEAVLLSGMIPFTITIADANIDDVFNTKVKINSSKLRGQKEIEIIAEVFVEYKKYNKEFVSYISSIEEIGDRPETAAGIRVYIVREGESLFGVAKTMSVRPEEILKQNPNIQGELTDGTRLIVYTPLDINF